MKRVGKLILEGKPLCKHYLLYLALLIKTIFNNNLLIISRVNFLTCRVI